MLRKKTPIGKLEEQPNVHPAQEKDPLPAHPGGVNPETGEVGGEHSIYISLLVSLKWILSLFSCPNS